MCVCVCVCVCVCIYICGTRSDAGSSGTPVDVARGELIYVPVYSRIFYEDTKAALELAATLSIHNVNPQQSITITKADYYDTAGKPIHKYVDAPWVLKPLETKNLVIEETNTAGGSARTSLVEWPADSEVTSPLVEALMVNASHNLGISFTSAGKSGQPLRQPGHGMSRRVNFIRPRQEEAGSTRPAAGSEGQTTAIRECTEMGSQILL